MAAVIVLRRFVPNSLMVDLRRRCTTHVCQPMYSPGNSERAQRTRSPWWWTVSTLPRNAPCGPSRTSWQQRSGSRCSRLEILRLPSRRASRYRLREARSSSTSTSAERSRRSSTIIISASVRYTAHSSSIPSGPRQRAGELVVEAGVFADEQAELSQEIGGRSRRPCAARRRSIRLATRRSASPSPGWRSCSAAETPRAVPSVGHSWGPSTSVTEARRSACPWRRPTGGRACT